MRITADTNVLVRAAVEDEPAQAAIARRLLQDADVIAVPLPVLCEFVWVLSRGYRRSTAEIISAIRLLVATTKVHADRPAVDAGLKFLEAGGDFADGVIAFGGRQLGGDVFASFDRTAVACVQALGGRARCLADDAG